MLTPTEHLNAAIAAINKRAKALPVDNTLFKHDGLNCSGGYYAPYHRLIYRCQDQQEFATLVQDFSHLDQTYREYYTLINDAPAPRYKNMPQFFSQISSATIKTHTAYESHRIPRNSDKLDRLFPLFTTTAAGNYKHDIAANLAILADSYQPVIEHIRKSTQYRIHIEQYNKGNRHIVAMNLKDYVDYHQAQQGECDSVTIRKHTGNKYTARLLSTEGEALDVALGVIILAPDSPLTQRDIYSSPPRKPSARSLERTSHRVTDIAGFPLDDLVTTLWINPK